MTSSSPTKSRPPNPGFTLIELLVVMGIMLVLMGLALPMITQAYRNGVRTRMRADLQVIAAGIDAYRADFSDIPRTDNSTNESTWGGKNYTGHLRGACTLCWALVAPGNGSTTAYNGNTVSQGYDGNDGPGFRVRGTQGQIYGPYINISHFKIGLINGENAGDNHSYFLADTYGNPYLYFPANAAAGIPVPATGLAPMNSTANGYIGSTSAGQTPMFDTDDNDLSATITSSLGSTTMFTRSTDSGSPSMWQQRFYAMLGDYTVAGAGTNFNGQIDTGETAKSTGPYILWGLGPDGVGGPDTLPNNLAIAQCDDVTILNP